MTEPTEELPFYANTANFSLGPFDIVMTFSYRTPDEQRRLVAEPKNGRTVVMSLAHAKTMLPILARMIAQYETEVGPITAPGFDEKGKE